MARLGPEERARGVVCSSAGNHAQGVALAASRLGCEATICMPTPTPEIKVAAVRRLGGKVVLVGDSYTETQAAAQKLAVEKGLAFVAPYDDPYTIAGQGTVGAEILRQLPTLPEGEVVVGGAMVVWGEMATTATATLQRQRRPQRATSASRGKASAP